jgi:hypothetical protein
MPPGHTDQPPHHPLSQRRRLLLALALGTLLALACALAGPWLTPPAIARWTFHNMEQDEARALLGLIGIRHLPIFLLAVASGRMIFQRLRSTAAVTVAVTALPYLLYVVVHGVLDALAAGEPAFSWVGYEPAYFIWPHFVTVPLGLWAGARMAARRRDTARSTAHQA